jgi:hypothetical protein
LAFATGDARDVTVLGFHGGRGTVRLSEYPAAGLGKFVRFELEGRVTAGVRRAYAVVARAIDGTPQTIAELGECYYYSDAAGDPVLVDQTNGSVTLEPGLEARQYTLEIRNARVTGSAAPMTTSFVRGAVYAAPTTAVVGVVPRAELTEQTEQIGAAERNARVAAGKAHDVVVWLDAPLFGTVTLALAPIARAVAVRVAFTGPKVSEQDAAISVLCAGASYGASADAALAVCGATNASALELEMSRPTGVTAVRAVEHETGTEYGAVGSFEVVGSRVVVARYTLGSSVARGGVRFEATLDDSETIRFGPVAVRARVQGPSGSYAAVIGAAAEIAVPFDAESVYGDDAGNALAVSDGTVRAVFSTSATGLVVAAKDTRERAALTVNTATWPRVTAVAQDAAQLTLTLSAPPPTGSTVSVDAAVPAGAVGTASLVGSTIVVALVATDVVDIGVRVVLAVPGMGTRAYAVPTVTAEVRVAGQRTTTLAVGRAYVRCVTLTSAAPIVSVTGPTGPVLETRPSEGGVMLETVTVAAAGEVRFYATVSVDGATIEVPTEGHEAREVPDTATVSANGTLVLSSAGSALGGMCAGATHRLVCTGGTLGATLVGDRRVAYTLAADAAAFVVSNGDTLTPVRVVDD